MKEFETWKKFYAELVVVRCVRGCYTKIAGVVSLKSRRRAKECLIM